MILTISKKRDGCISSKDNLNNFLKAKKIDKDIAIPKLCHGNTVKIINKDFDISDLENVDGLLTKDDLFLAVTVSDCLPIYFYNNEMHAILHAGWKGISVGIIEKMVKKIKEIKEVPENIDVFIGPSIGVCHFEVQDDLIKTFSDFSDCFQKKEQKNYLDLKKVAVKKLKKQNFRRIEVSPVCTFCTKEYFSFRREGVLNKMIAIIGR